MRCPTAVDVPTHRTSNTQSVSEATADSPTPSTVPRSTDGPAVSIIVPVRDEEENIAPLIAEIHAAMQPTGVTFELIYVDDGSRDGTASVLLEAGSAYPGLRIIRHRRSYGQSAALLTGALHARGHTLVTLDGDLQNDPADIPTLLTTLWRSRATGAGGLVAGQRRVRRDKAVRRWSSRFANALRSRLLRDGVRDTGCGLKALPRDVFLQLPSFNHMHRFLPALVRRGGYVVHLIEVNHRPRRKGVSKYGTLDRLWVGIVDLLGVMWLQRRAIRTELLPDS